MSGRRVPKFLVVQLSTPGCYHRAIAAQTLKQAKGILLKFGREQELGVVEEQHVAGVAVNELAEQPRSAKRPLLGGQLEQPLGQLEVDVDQGPSAFLGELTKGCGLTSSCRSDDQNKSVIGK
ncbi:MAG: hypothetical protein A2284_01920 [Deltaproteobacteria bacterium RIFOXYA12_FULL_61_11]|nr:MAG: hypothetical protein A2284_01920 [Deltaproteobacteria bacterium RIFOXYA12_FULL_61_11]